MVLYRLVLNGPQGRPNATARSWSYDIPAAVVELKQNESGDLMIMGSGRLIRSLLPHGLIDEYLLCVYPLVLGSGQRLFDHDNEPIQLRLVDSIATTTGVIIATYHPER